MATRRSYLPEDSIYPFQGLNTQDTSTLIQSSFSPDELNVLTTEGVVERRKGYYALAGSSLQGTVKALVLFTTVSGTRHLVALTTKRQYRYDTSTSDWVDITPTSSGTPVEWTGDEDDFIDYVVATDNSGQRLIITNGKDTPRTWAGTGEFADWTPTYTDFVTCKTLDVFFDHLVLGNVTTTSNEPKVIAWSDTGDFDNFSTGNSGTNLVADAQGSIKRILPIGDRLAVYAEDSLTSIVYVGGDAIFQFETIIRGTRLYSPATIESLGPYHVFASEEDLYMFDGTRGLRAVGYLIRKSYRQDLNMNSPVRSFMFNDYPRRRLYFVLRRTDDTTVLYVLRYDLFDLESWRWDKLQYNDAPTAFGFFPNDTFKTYQDYDGVQYNAVDLAYDSQANRALFPVRVFGSSTDVFVDDETRRTDGGVVIEGYWESKDFTMPQEYQSLIPRWIDLEVEAQGGPVEVEVSTNQGRTFESVATLADTVVTQVGGGSPQTENIAIGVMKTFRVPIDQRGRSLRVRLSSKTNGRSFRLNWLRAWFRPGGPR